MSRFTETFPTQAGNAKVIVSTFQQVQRQAVTGNTELIADRSNINENIKRGMWIEGVEVLDCVELVRQ